LHWDEISLAARALKSESAAESPAGHMFMCATRTLFPQKKRPPISPAWIYPGLVIGGARSRNHKKTRRRCDTLSAHLLDRIQMYAERNNTERFVRVAAAHFWDNAFKLQRLIYSGQRLYRHVLYAVQGIQKSIRLVFHTGDHTQDLRKARLNFDLAGELSSVERDCSTCAEDAGRHCAISIAPTFTLWG
jgi:hypothetical protein